MSCVRSADIYLSGDAIAKCSGNHVGVYVTYVPQLVGTKMFINKYNDLLLRCVNGENIRLNIKFFDENDQSVLTSKVDLSSDDFANYPEYVARQVKKIDAVCDKDFAPVGILFGPESSLASAFIEILRKKGIKVSELPAENKKWVEIFKGASYTCDAHAEGLPGLYDELVSILKHLGLIEPEYICKETGGEKQKEKQKQKYQGGAKKDISIKGLLQKLNTLVDKL